MSTFVIVHGAWHHGELYEGVAAHLRAMGHTVHTPTLLGNGVGDSKQTTLEEAIGSLLDYFAENSIEDAVLVGHSWGGMVITAAADRLPAGPIRRLVYWSAYVPHDGESLVDITPAVFGEMFTMLREEDGGVPMLYPVFREALINDADEETAKRFHAQLVTQPFNTMFDKVSLTRDPSDLAVGKSFLHCQEDMVYPASAGGWHPQFSERLGIYRFVSMPGSHEACLTTPDVAAAHLVKAGRD
ncbi:alpha/beta fold hydrolase [Microbacterium sp. X-17]|uniref:alpha/beta hydrolase n=1 Tax=Microbacterium sp. X-17 TaxID=3144404 RepID=UPI0031F4AB23